MNSIIFTAGARILVALLFVFSLFMLLRGHHLPGGGFIGGLLGAVAFIVYSLACGPAEAKSALRASPEGIAAVGLGIALVAGLVAFFFGDPFFTGQWYWVGGDSYETSIFSLNTVLVFDIGVYLVVLGSILSIAYAFEEET
ncbi:MnhB domain-containing protein [Roseinatronobacter sp. S2]|uniref:MnhB domain-containing protein n=1 Tax=Roseinatronobacter sp. S2 TaxID=3035471 RepID=UPI00241058DD|nr:MnhB domain-containing protein [Roseinatronobacter sp. S2]MCC5958701.1 Na(+)/H(+) antiporter subunit B [Paracoccaceae bacterium]WFE73676.1 MnhB domain-containing protein [Roseinatronobacter sp. S2]